MKKLVVILIFVAAIFGCQRDDFEKVADESTFGIEQAKAWYEANKPVKLELKSGNGNEIENTLLPNWNKAKKSENENFIVVTVDLLTDRGFGFILNDAKDKWQASKNFDYHKSITQMVVSKHRKTNKIENFLMTTIGNKEYLEKTFFNPGINNSYLKKDKDFCGQVLYHSLNGKFTNGWKFTNGKVTHRINLSHHNLPLKLKSGSICTTTYTTFWYFDITYNVYFDFGSGLQYSYSQYGLKYTSVPTTECQLVDDSGGGDNGSYEPYATDPCGNCSNFCNDCGGCLDDLQLKSANAACPPCSCPKVILNDPSFVGTKAECVYNKLALQSTLLNDLQGAFELSEKYDLTYKVVPNMYVVGGGGQVSGTHDYNFETNSAVIEINSYYFDKETPVTLAKTILHETIHAKISQKLDRAGGFEYLRNEGFEERIKAYYRTFINYGSNYTDHQIIADFYINKMAQTLKDFDVYNNYSLKFYIALSWHGLYETNAWKGLTVEKQNEIRDIWKIINEGEKNCK